MREDLKEFEMIFRLTEGDLETKSGTFREILYFKLWQTLKTGKIL